MPWEELDGMDDMTPEEIATRAAWAAVNDGAWDDALAIEKEPYCREIAAAIKALTDAGKVIVDAKTLVDAADRLEQMAYIIPEPNHCTEQFVRFAIDLHALVDRAMTTDTGS